MFFFFFFGKPKIDVSKQIQEDCSCPLASWDFITSGRSGGAEYGVNSKCSNVSTVSLERKEEPLRLKFKLNLGGNSKIIYQLLII